jgi:hypothetical protein
MSQEQENQEPVQDQSNWKRWAAALTVEPNPDWVDMLRENLRQAHHQLVTELSMAGDLEAFLKVRVATAMAEHDQRLAEGIPEPIALELTMADMLIPERETTEDYEEEGATADIIAAVEKQLLTPSERQQQ